MIMHDRIFHNCAALEESYTEVHHPSGLTVLVSEKPLSTYHAALGVRYGSADRLALGHPMGVAHFLEHKMFERAGGSFDDDFAALGAEANAYTSYDRTVYMFSCTEHFGEALTLLLQMVSSLAVTRRSVARERDIIAEEIRMNADDPWERCYAEMLRGLYRAHPVREEICGSEASIARITPRVLEKAFEAFYRPDNMVLSVSGRTDMDAVLAAVDRVWPTPRGVLPPRPPLLAIPLPRENGAAYRTRVSARMAAAKPLFCIGAKLPDVPNTPRGQLACDLGMTVLSEMLFSHSGDFYSELFESGRVSPGMAYGASLGEGYGYFALSGECDDPDAVMAAFLHYVADIRRTGLSLAEFERARRILYADYVTGFDATEDIASSMGGYALDSLHREGSVGLYDFLAASSALTLADVTALFDAAFSEGQYTLSAVYPIDGEETERTCL